VAAFEKMFKNLPDLTDDIDPDSAKPIRKNILYTRNLMDIFVYAYPPSPKDWWKTIRKQLDTGYETIGYFHDLSGSEVDYTPEELDELRAPCIEWKNTFLKKASKDDYLSYLRNPSYLKIFEREKVPGFFWKEAEIKPNLKYSGIENIAILTDQLLQNLLDRLDGLLALRDVTTRDNQEIFHDFRKSCRGLIYLQDTFSVYEESYCKNATVAEESIERIYDDLGDLNDLYLKYQFEIRKGDDSKAIAVKDEVDKKWTEITGWLENDRFADQISCLRSTLRVP
jgi:CHAD domain-containing protein